MLKQKVQKKYLIIFLACSVAALLLGALYVAAQSNKEEIQPVKQTPAQEIVDNNAQPQESVKTPAEPDDEEPGNTLTENEGSSTVEESEVIVESDNPILSEDGKTSLFSPSTDEIIETGSVISGSSENPNVFYRLIDSKVGVIGEGKLNLKENKFSNKLTIENHGSAGRLDIFSRNSDGTEYSTIYINVGFKND